MNKQEFLEELRKGLCGLPQEDIEERVNFYDEMIDDRIEEGLSEIEAVEAIGTVDTVISQILAETPLTKLVKERVKPNRRLRTWEIVIIILGSPLWFSLLIAMGAIVFAGYVVIWSGAIILWSLEVSLIGIAFGELWLSVVSVIKGEGLTGLAMLGIAMFAAGGSIFMFYVCKAVTKYMVVLTKKIAFGIKSMFVGKEAA